MCQEAGCGRMFSMNTLLVASAVLAVVSFKDAAKIKSWDAWSDNGKTPTHYTFKERRCVTREKLLKMDPGTQCCSSFLVWLL